MMPSGILGRGGPLTFGFFVFTILGSVANAWKEPKMDERVAPSDDKIGWTRGSLDEEPMEPNMDEDPMEPNMGS